MSLVLVIREVDGRDLAVAQHASSTAVWLRERLRTGIHSAKPQRRPRRNIYHRRE